MADDKKVIPTLAMVKVKAADGKTDVQPMLKNALAALLCDVTLFKAASNGKVYANNDGTSMKKVADWSIHFATVPGLTLTGNVYARKSAQATYTAEASLIGSRAGQAIEALDEVGQATLAEIKKFVADRYVEWYAGHAAGIVQAPTAAALGKDFGGF